MLAVNGACCRGNLCLITFTGISGARFARELAALVCVYGKPDCYVSENGTEFTSGAILKWAGENDMNWHYMEPEKLQQSGFIESSNGSLGGQLLTSRRY